MKKSMEDPVLAEMHAIKDSISAEFGHDIDALFTHLREVEAGMSLTATISARRVRTAPRVLAVGKVRPTTALQRRGTKRVPKVAV
jgi:hypothetical protein